MKHSDIIEELRDLIAKDEIKLVFQSLRSLLRDSKLLESLLIQSARYNEVLEEIRNGTIDYEQSKVPIDQVRVALIEIISLIDEGAIKTKKVRKELVKKYVRIGVKTKKAKMKGKYVGGIINVHDNEE